MTTFIARRAVQRYTMHLDAPPEQVFPLLCPVRETEWIEPWACEMVHSASGIAEDDCVFRTNFPSQGGEEIWVVSRYQPPQAIEFVRLQPEVKVNRLNIALHPDGDGGCLAEWTNIYTGLSEAGNRWIASHTDQAFLEEKAMLAKMLNHFLQTGTMFKAVQISRQEGGR